MLNLHFAPSARFLVPKLLGRIRSVWTDPFHPPTLLVPSPAVGKWLQLRLADCEVPDTSGRPLALGCIANCEMLTLERFLWNAFGPAKNMQRMDVAIMQQVICALLDTSLLKESAYESVNAYLKKPDGTIDPVKRVQLASKIARQFQEYEFNRPSVWDEEHRRWRLDGIDAKWLKNIPYLDDNSENEQWQKDLYCKTHKCLDHAGASDKIRYISLPHLYRLRRKNCLENNMQWTVAPDHIFLFGVSKVSHFHRNTLVEISQMPGMDMHVFLTNPCAEFWEDVDTRRRRGRLRRAWKHDSVKKDAGITARDPGDYSKEDVKEIAPLPPDHALLELWGNAGKANIFLWCAHAQWNFEYDSPAWVEEEKDPDTLLKAIQYSLLRCQNELKGGWRNDASLQVLACPDPAREVEELREQVLDLVKNNSVRQLNEIVVYLPDPGAYVSQIHRVFGSLKQSDPGYIPYSVLGAPGSDSLFAQGMHTLLEIFEGRFDRARVFALLRNPIVQSTRKISAEDVVIWERWAEELGIFRGYNREHRKVMGDRGQTVTDAHTFELGIGRLLIGNLAAGPVDMKYRLLACDREPAAAAAGNEVVPVPAFRDFDTPDADRVETFCSLVEDLYKDAELLIAQTSLSASVDIMTGLVWDWFGIVLDDTPGTMASEGRVKSEFLEALPAIKIQDELANRKEKAGLKEFLALVRECLPEELPAGSRAWTGGITFAPLRPAMIVPHKVIFALGLDATAFPGTSDRPAWDLLSQKRIVGDSDPVRDNRFAFLELLHEAQERLVLSFRARNMQKEEVLQPSSVVLELESYLKGQGLKEASDEDRCLIRREIPWIVRESLEELKTTGRHNGTWDASEVRLARIEQQAGARKATYRYGTAVGTKENAVQGHLRTTIYDLCKFFANPLEYHLSRTLGIEIGGQPATMGATDEPLQSGPLEMSGLQKEIWTGLLLRVFPENPEDACTELAALGDEAEKTAREVHAQYVVKGGSPEAQLCLMEERFLINWARDCAAATLDLRHTAYGSHKLIQNVDLSLGRPGAVGDLTVDMGNQRDCLVECRHRLALVPHGDTGEIGIISIKTKGEAKENPDLWLTGVIQWLAEQNEAKPERFAVQLVQLNRGNAKDKVVGWNKSVLKEGKVDDIKVWLANQIQDMLINRCADHLPFAVILDLTKQGRKNPLTWDQRWARVTGANIEERLSDEEHGPYRCYLEAFKLADARIPFSNETDEAGRDGKLVELAKARFAPMLEEMEP
jgi:exonuclease V gamma subunit